MTEEQDNQVQQEINKAINFLGQNKFLEAENTCLKIIDSGDNADAYHILSSIKIYQQEFEDSIKYVKKSILNVGRYCTVVLTTPIFNRTPSTLSTCCDLQVGFTTMAATSVFNHSQPETPKAPKELTIITSLPLRKGHRQVQGTGRISDTKPIFCSSRAFLFIPFVEPSDKLSDGFSII